MYGRAAQVRAAAAALPMLRKQAADTSDDATLVEMQGLFPVWAVGTSYKAGGVTRHGANLYRVMQDHTAQAHQPPDAAGMLAVYAPIQQSAAPGQVLDWVYGEAGLAIGDKRRDPTDGKVYELLQHPGANVWEPHAAPSLWRVVDG
jgi:hypothetical protein